MKKTIILAITIMFSTYSQAQLAIGKDEVTNDFVSLEFAENENRGLLLPWVDNESAVSSAELGTLIYDADEKKVKVKYADGWKDLSIKEGATIHPISGVDALDIQTPLTESSDAKVSIGEPNPNVDGILVLEDTDKAMVLPKVTAPHDNIINPTPGLMVYDPTAKEFAVFNGEDWTFWKPQD